MIMRGRAVHIGPKPPQQIDLTLTKLRDVGERLRPRKDCKKNQEQYFRQRIIYLAGLTMIRQLAEIVEKTRRLSNLCKPCPVGIHYRTPDVVDHDRFSNSAFCHAPLHPIALPDGTKCLAACAGILPKS
jgi:hypothetical protein